jgi:hypothetical protein
MNAISRLEALANGPKPWLVTSVWSHKTHTLRQPMEVQARRYAEREAERIGKDLINRETGETVQLLSVTVEYAPE